MGNPQSASRLTHLYWGFDVSSLLLLGAPFFHDLSGNLQHPSPSDRGVTRCIDAGDDATMERVTWARS